MYHIAQIIYYSVLFRITCTLSLDLKLMLIKMLLHRLDSILFGRLKKINAKYGTL